MKVFSGLRQRYRYSAVLLRQLVITDFKLRYQGSVLGYLWSFLRPLALFSILYVVFVDFLKVGKDVPHFPIYLLLGIVLWSFFVEATSLGLKAIVDRDELIRKLNFPRYIIVMSIAASSLVNLLLNLVVVGVFMLFSGIHLEPMALLAPLFILELFVLAVGLAFLLSALYVRFRDLTYIWEVVLQALFYATPIIYPLSQVQHSYQLIIMLNPLAQLVQGIRYVLVTTNQPTVSSLYGVWWVGPAMFVSVFVFAGLAAWYFKVRSSTFAEDV